MLLILAVVFGGSLLTLCRRKRTASLLDKTSGVIDSFKRGSILNDTLKVASSLPSSLKDVLSGLARLNAADGAAAPGAASPYEDTAHAVSRVASRLELAVRADRRLSLRVTSVTISTAWVLIFLGLGPTVMFDVSRIRARPLLARLPPLPTRLCFVRATLDVAATAPAFHARSHAYACARDCVRVHAACVRTPDCLTAHACCVWVGCVTHA